MKMRTEHNVQVGKPEGNVRRLDRERESYNIKKYLE